MDENGNGNGGGSTSARRGRGDFEGPSSSRQRTVNEIWPEPFVEALAAQVAIGASHSIGRLAAAPALANLFQVCSTWRAVSRSDLLWQRLTRHVWRRTHLLRDTWHDEFVYWHRTAQNFRMRRSSHATLNFFDQSDVDDPDGNTCRCLALSDRHVACGFADGVVRLFEVETLVHVRTFRAHHDNRFGRFSRAVSGIIIVGDTRLIFATLDGDIHVALIDEAGPASHPRRAHLGNVVNDGALVDFTGCERWWVGLYAGAPGRAFHIWDGITEEPVFVGGSLTDPQAVPGWHMLTEVTEVVGRVRVTTQESAVACTSARVIVFDLRNQGVVLGEEECRRGLVVTSVDVSDEAYVSVNGRGIARVRRVGTLEEVCRFNVGGRGPVVGCMNLGYALMCVGGVIRVWEVKQGENLGRFRERVGELNALVANERHVAASSTDTTIHLWDFGPQD
ncbi:Transcriptional regulator STERILE APETALA [Morella rubra]|uniref:Transcriptional regulator STERILE APETALA n=1 Tax=Morella rubra TaxID=262757 RepID=A0A6A1V7K9_9ROSI|nr:Transcriptional regulator STERILE APETALA [Morella rubra]